MYIKRYMIKDMWGLFCAKAFQFQSIKTANPKKINENQVSFDSILVFLMFRWNLRVHCIVLYLLNHDILAKPQPVSVNINNAGKKS